MENLDVIRQVRITKETNEEIVKIAEKWRVPYSTVIRLAIDRYLEYVKGQNAIDEYIEKNPNTQESEDRKSVV